MCRRYVYEVLLNKRSDRFLIHRSSHLDDLGEPEPSQVLAGFK